MRIFKKNFVLFAVVNFTLVSVPLFLAGCGGANTNLASNAVTAGGTAGTSASSGSGSGSSTGSNDGASTGSSGSSSSAGSSSGSTSSSAGSSSSGSTSNSSGSTSNSSGSTSNSSGSSSSGSSSSGSTSSSSSNSSSGSSSGSSANSNAVPAGALSISAIQKLSNWDGVYDTATGNGGATSSGSMSLTGSPSRSGAARKFVMSYKNSGGERYWVSFGSDTASTNFFWDGWIYIANSAANIANIELDMNQVTSNGQTVIYGFQCDGYSGTWDYTRNSGTPSKPNDAWIHSSASCNPRKWKINTWHHVQISYSRDKSGNVTYHYVALDGAKQAINATAPSTFALGWSSTLLTNFQVDGLGASGSATVYLDDLTISRW